MQRLTQTRDPGPMQWRILVWTSIIVTVSLGMPAWLFYRSLSTRIVDLTQNESLQQFRFVEELYEKNDAIHNVEDLQEWVGLIGTSLGSRLTVLDESGRVIADSEIPREEMSLLENFANRPEMLQLQHKEIGLLLRLSQLTQKEFVFLAKRVKSKSQSGAAYLRLAVPSSHVKDLLGQVREALVALVLAGIAGATASVFFVVRRNMKLQMSFLAASIQELASGRYRLRIPTYPEHELYPLISVINEMAKGIQRHIRSISDQQRQWEAIFNGMEEGVMVLDPRGRIERQNRALSKLTRGAEHNIGKRPLEVIMSNELQSVCDQVLNPLDPEDAGHPRGLSITLSNGQIYDVTIVRSELHDGRMGVILVFRDLTELRRLERVRQDFVANVSHELRTPLTSVKGYVETLIDDPSLDRETATSFLRVIKNNTDHMVKIVDDLLQLARLQARDSSTPKMPMDASKALATAWKACEPLARDKGVHLLSQLPEEGAVVLGDPDRIVQVFRNLLENAIRYSPEHGAIVAGYGVRGREGLFSIQDNGPGIPWQHQQRVFERFYRVEKDRKSRFGSTGLGLAICRHILINHGGRIWVQSPNPDEVHGTTIFFTLERPPDGDTDAAATDAVRRPA